MRQRSPGIGLLRRGVIAGLAVAILLGAVAYSVQFRHGLGVTGLSRAVPWGLYISQFTFLVGVAASSVLVVLPRHVHGRRDGAELVLVGEALSVAALLEAFTFVLVDLGRPERVLHVLLHPSPSSLMFWDILTLSGYLVVCAAVLAGSLL
ncbi:MAG TPA: polysulfide reductase NrfD, partial [Polyangiaceae bacterium]|nr:polysulfide reductase NrfD [Polyangiaceae bacterium]